VCGADAGYVAVSTLLLVSESVSIVSIIVFTFLLEHQMDLARIT
jgi:hypothetical protein